MIMAVMDRHHFKNVPHLMFVIVDKLFASLILQDVPPTEVAPKDHVVAWTAGSS